MKRIALVLTLVMALLFSAVAGTQFIILASANPIMILPYITVKSDGTVDPSTDLIKQVGNVYSLTGNIFQKYSIIIQCSNIVFDGAGNTIDGNGHTNQGLALEGVTNVTIKNLAVKGFNNNGILLENCSRCVILKGNLTYNSVGLDLRQSNFNTIAENNIDHNYYGIYTYQANHNTISRNNITWTTSEWVINMLDSQTNTIFKNNIVGNSIIVKVEPSGRVDSWDNGSMGNYWSDYNGNDTNHDGIGDTPYMINDKNQDNYPLMVPVDNLVPSIKVLSPENKTYEASDVLLNVTINESVSQIRYSLDGQDNVTIAGNTTLTDLSNGNHNLTVYATDKAGNTGTSETITFSIVEPFPTVLIATSSVVSVAVISIGLLVYFRKRKH